MTVANLSLLAQMAQGSYAALSAGMPVRDLELALQSANGGFAATQAQAFAAKHKVVLQYNDDASLLIGNGTSLSVTVFKDASTNQLTLAIRGTAESADWATGNNGIMSGGTAYPQVAALYNWWLRATAVPGTPVPQYTVSLTGGGDLVRKDDALATGELRSALIADPDQRLDVAGHSLGGHLVMAFGTLFAGSTASIDFLRCNDSDPLSGFTKVIRLDERRASGSASIAGTDPLYCRLVPRVPPPDPTVRNRFHCR